MKKLVLIGIVGLVFSMGLVFAINYGYTHLNGSEIFYNEDGNIVGIHDSILNQSRYPTNAELEENDYIPMSQEVTFANCLTNKGVIFYGAYWCPACQKQKEILGDNLKDINYFECEDDKQTCMDEGIKAYPTWKMNDKSYMGVKSLKELSLLFGCELV